MIKNFSVLFLFFLTSCSISFSPPPRVSYGSMPEANGAKNVNLQGSLAISAGDFFVPEIRAGYGLTDRWDLEASAMTVWSADNGSNPNGFVSFYGTTGLKYHFLNHEKWRIAASGGIGLGCGGYLDNSSFDSDPDEFAQGCDDFGFSYGLYTELAFGYRFSSHFGIYEANRYELSHSDGLPLTHWGSHALGLQYDWTKSFFTSLEGGIIYYSNSYNNDQVSALASLTFGYKWGRK